MVRIAFVSTFVALLAVASAASTDNNTYRIVQPDTSKSPSLRYGTGGRPRARAAHPAALPSVGSSPRPLAISIKDTTPVTDVATLKQYGYYSMAAGRTQTVGQWSCGFICNQPSTAGTVVTAIIDKTSPDPIHSIIARNDNLKQVIVGFRGSTDVSWTNNLDFAHHDWPVNVGFGTPGVHNGFFNGYAAGADDIYAAAVAQLTKYPTYQLVFAGYSLGGAHATIAAVDFQLRNPALAAKTKVFTYGSPRVGDTDFAAYYNSRGFLLSARTTAKKDMVVHLPPQWAGYTHVNREYWIDLSGNVKVCSAAGTGEDGSCQNSVHFWDYSTGDHTGGYWDCNN